MKHENNRPRRTAVVLDPHPLCHAALAALLREFDIEVVGAAASADTASALLEEHRPALLVAEVDLPEGREAGLRMLSDARRDDPDLVTIVLSACADRSLIDASFDHGATAYVLKTSDPDAIAIAVRQAFEPSIYLARPREQPPVENLPEPQKVLGKLTRRELEILQLVSEGRSNRQVAEILWVTDQTVKFHLANVYRKLGVRSRFDAAHWARANGLLEAAEPSEMIMSAGATVNGIGNGGAKLVSLRPVAAPEIGATERFEETSR
jgi:DNA-binding NarL/FixJ family response regulator